MRILIAFLTLLAGCGGGRAQCEAPGDCPAGQVCLLPAGAPGSCVTTYGACDGTICPAGLHCEQEVCVAGATPCGGPAECGADQLCLEGTCGCRNDAGCAAPDVCGDDGRCRPRPCTGDRQCDLAGICSGDVCVAGCRIDSDCPELAPVCDPAAGEHGTCVACLGDRDCPSAAPYCALAECVECRTPDDCGGAACEAGSCAAILDPTQLDLLVVVDNSFSMGTKQQKLLDGWDEFLAELAAGTGLPSLHLGVVSTDVGTEPYDQVQCVGGGDRARLLYQRSLGCTAGPVAPARFLADVIGPSGQRLTNYEGTLAEAFGCIADLGDHGCGQERPLDAIRRALDPTLTPENLGFLRPEAHLAVLVLSDEDDCSASDSAVYDPAPEAETTLGPNSSFRCTEFGVRCDGGTLVRAAASYTTCEPRTDSHLIDPVATAQYLRSLRPGPDGVVVGLVTGPRAPFSVTINADGDPRLHPSCGAGGDGAAPAVRLEAFAAAAPRRSVSSICDGDLGPGLRAFAREIKAAMGRP